MVSEEALRRGEGGVSDHVGTAVYINGYNFPTVSFLHVTTNIPVIDRITPSSGLLGGITRLSSWHRVPPERMRVIPWSRFGAYYTGEAYAVRAEGRRRAERMRII
jgi:hypothetical protein